MTPLAEFCARLSGLVDESGIKQAALVEPTGRSKQALSSVLRGEIKRAPDWAVVWAVVETCAKHAEKHGRILGVSVDKSYWRQEHALLERSLDRTEEKTPEARPGRPIVQWDPFRLGVHQVIAVGSPTGTRPLPPYITRRHDRELQRLLQAPERHPMIVLTGSSCTGKTRAAWEAVNRALPRWPLLRPFNGTALLSAVEDGLPGPVVLWLDELQRYVEGADAVVTALDELISGDTLVVVLATMPATAWDTFTARPAQGTADPHAAVRELLNACRHIAVPERLGADPDAMRRLAELGGRDARLAYAGKAAGQDGKVIQALTGGPELVRRHRDGTDPVCAGIVTAAADAGMLGTSAPVPAGFLREAAPHYLRPEQRAVGEETDWFTEGLAAATFQVHGVAALTGVREQPGMGPPDGYRTHEFLAQHIHGERRWVRVPAGVWEALARWVSTDEDRLAVAKAAGERNLKRLAATVVRPVAEAGDHAGLARMLTAMADHPDRDAWVRYGAARDDGSCQWEMAERAREEERDADAAYWWRRLVVADDGRGMSDLVGRLRDAGLLDEALQWLSPAVTAGSWIAVTATVKVLRAGGRIQEAVRLLVPLAERGDLDAAVALTGLVEDAGERWRWRVVCAEAGHRWSMVDLAAGLRERGDHAEAGSWLEKAAAAGSRRAIRTRQKPLLEAGRYNEAAELWRVRADQGSYTAKSTMADLFERGGDLDAAEAVWRRLAGSGDLSAMRSLGELLARAGRWADAERWLRRAAVEIAGKTALSDFLAVTGRGEEALELWREAAEAGEEHSVRSYAELLKKVRGADHARSWLEERADTGDVECMFLLADLQEDPHAAERWVVEAAEGGHGLAARGQARVFEERGEADRAIEVLRPSASTDRRSRLWLRTHLERAGRLAEAEAVTRELMEFALLGGPWLLAEMLRDQGKEDEAGDLLRYGIEPGGATARPWSVLPPEDDR
ncbi:tetratricopeptide repeat protein [Sphaerisporangium aureirubrum]|uniref:Tetratricopeptide repeat protein n=1 Tax=Sphaerisporangium aureirubrum TaxID=1544736 RepID=A0ABW1NRM1_9ACTN